jgi:hypothetical protein
MSYSIFLGLPGNNFAAEPTKLVFNARIHGLSAVSILVPAF